MFANRIGQYFMDEPERPEETNFVRQPTGFAMLPAFGTAPSDAAAKSSGPPDIYRVAYEQARREVAARRERTRRAHEWN